MTRCAPCRRSRLSLRRRWLAVLVIALLACSRPPSRTYPAAAASPEAGRAGEPLPVPSDPPGRLCAVGVVVAERELDVVAPMAGRLDLVDAPMGRAVPAGAVLARVEQRLLVAELAGAEADRAAAEAEVESAQATLLETRQRHARRKAVAGLFAAEEVEEAWAKLAVASAGLARAKAVSAQRAARVSDLQVRVSRTEIRAPFKGAVALRFREPGDWVEPGTRVVRLVSEDSLRLRFALERDAASSVGPGVAVTFAGSSGAVARGVVEQVAAEVEPTTGLTVVEASLAAGGAGGKLRPGAAGRVTLGGTADCEQGR